MFCDYEKAHYDIAVFLELRRPRIHIKIQNALHEYTTYAVHFIYLHNMRKIIYRIA